jgi:hypothetical protein
MNDKWSAVSAVAAVAALFLPLLLFVFGRDMKELTVETVSSAILVDLSNPMLSSLRLTYKDQSVSRLSVATIEVRNSGTRTIERSDFELPIVLRFQNPLDVLAVTLNEKSPHDLKPLISSDGSGISIAPLLLNPGDQFRMTIQLRGDFNEPEVEARISGVPTISRKIFRSSDPTRRGILLLASGIVTSWVYFYIALFSSDTFRLRRSFTLMPIPENLVVVLALGFGSAALYALGAKTLELSHLQTLSWAAVGLPPALLFGLFARRRSRRLCDALKP